MEPFLSLLLLQFIIVCITDISGFPEEALYPLFKKITGSKVGKPLKIWTCSLCQTTWIGIIYLLIVGQFNLFTLAYTLLIAILTPITGFLIHFVIDFFTSVFEGLYKFFNL